MIFKGYESGDVEIPNGPKWNVSFIKDGVVRTTGPYNSEHTQKQAMTYFTRQFGNAQVTRWEAE